jgi:hypothetical protein
VVLCVKSPRFRRVAVNSGGHAPPSDCSGTFELDLSAFAAGVLGGAPEPAPRIPGTIVDCQWLGRDPGSPSPGNWTLSGRLEFSVRP